MPDRTGFAKTTKLQFFVPSAAAESCVRNKVVKLFLRFLRLLFLIESIGTKEVPTPVLELIKALLVPVLRTMPWEKIPKVEQLAEIFVMDCL